MDAQTDNDVNRAIAEHESQKAFQLAIPVITLSTDESDQEDELPPQSNTFDSSNLKLAFEVEYKALLIFFKLNNSI